MGMGMIVDRAYDTCEEGQLDIETRKMVFCAKNAENLISVPQRGGRVQIAQKGIHASNKRVLCDPQGVHGGMAWAWVISDRSGGLRHL